MNLALDNPRDALRIALAAEYTKSQTRLGKYIRGVWDILEPKTELRWNWHHDLISEHLEACASGQINRLLINVCPRSLKSMLATVSFPTWVWTRQPYRRFLFGSFSESLATKHSIFRRNVIESNWYQAGWGKTFKLSADVNTKSEFANNKTGMMRSSGINAVPTGEGGDYVIIDDPHNPQGAESDADRERAIQNFDLGWQSRLNDKKTGCIIIIMQRLHTRDLTGHILEKDMGYTHLKIKTQADEYERHVYPVSGKVKERQPGDLVHPERDGPAEIEKERIALTAYGFEGQHQQSPVQRGGNLFKDTMFDFVDIEPDAEFTMTWLTADTAYKDGKRNDWNVFSVWGLKNNDPNLYLVDCLRAKMKASQCEEIAVPFILKHSNWGFRGAYIEPKGHGIYLNQVLPLGTPTRAPVPMPSADEVKEFFKDRTQDKEARGNAATPHLTARKVLINNAILCKQELLAEALAFPNGANDDFVDTLIDGIKFAYTRSLSILDVL